MEFVIDVVGSENPLTDRTCEVHDTDIGVLGLPNITVQEYSKLVTTKSNTKVVSKSKKKSNDDVLDSFYEDMGWTGKNTKVLLSSINPAMKVNVEEQLKTSIIKPGFEQLHNIPVYNPAEKQLKSQRRSERSKTKGSKWFNLPATEITDQVKKDLEVLQMRSVLNPKQFYKKNDLSVLPKYFQIGKVMDSPLEYYNGRLTKKERKSTMVDELLANAEFAKYNKKRYKEIIEQRHKNHFKAHQRAKKLKGKRN